MIELTQTDIVSGNCWQFAIACILELEPTDMPDQVFLEAETKFGYGNAVKEYLVRHHQLMYSELQDWQFSGLRVSAMDGYHMLVGPTVRTEQNNMHHVVVAKHGKMVWDPHPSHDGLLRTSKWGILTPAPIRFIKQRQEQKELEGPQANAYKCYCPTCGGT